MSKRRHTAEEIVAKLWQVDVLTAQGRSVRGDPLDWRDGGQLRDELLNGEIFYRLKEAQIVIESWRRHYNTACPHSSLGYKPSAPEALPVLHRSFQARRR